MFSMQSVSLSPLLARFQLSSAASLNLGLSQNGILGNGLKEEIIISNKIYFVRSGYFYAFSLVQPNILWFGKDLIVNHTILTLNEPKEKAF